MKCVGSVRGPPPPGTSQAVTASGGDDPWRWVTNKEDGINQRASGPRTLGLHRGRKSGRQGGAVQRLRVPETVVRVLRNPRPASQSLTSRQTEPKSPDWPGMNNPPRDSPAPLPSTLGRHVSGIPVTHSLAAELLPLQTPKGWIGSPEKGWVLTPGPVKVTLLRSRVFAEAQAQMGHWGGP